MESTIGQDVIDKSEAHILKMRKDFSDLMKENEALIIHADCSTLLEMKDKFIAFFYNISSVEPRYLELHLIASDELKAADYESLMHHRKKGETVKDSEIKAVFETALERMKKRITEVNYKSVRNLRDVCQKVIDAIIQRISVTKNEEFNSRNTNAA